MKSKWLAGLVALAVFSWGPWMQAQTPDPGKTPASDPAKGTAQDTPQETPQKPAPAPTLPTADDNDMKHNGGKTDVDAVGNRTVGCGRGVGNWYSIETQVSMGRRVAQEIESQVKLVNDPVVTEYVNRLGQNLVRNSDAQVPFTIKVIDSDVVNAMALPGGFFYVNSGLILAADEEAEVAGVMAHEIAHVAARHGTRQATRGTIAQLATIPLIFWGGWAAYGVRQATSILLPLGFLQFSRAFESEADMLGLQYMYKTGYDPTAFVDFFEKLQTLEKKKPGTLSKAFSTHPPTDNRIKESQKNIQEILAEKPEYVLNRSEFNDVKNRLLVMHNHRKIDDKDAGRPKLRKAPGSGPVDADDKGDKKKGDDGDDRPTLKRRPTDN